MRIIKYSRQVPVRVRREKDWEILRSKLFLIVITIVRGSLLIWLVLPTPPIVSLMLGLKLLTFVRVLLGFVVGLGLCFLNLKGLYLIFYLDKVLRLIRLLNLSILSGSSIGLARKFINCEFKNADLGWNEVFSGKGFYFLFLKRDEILIM